MVFHVEIKSGVCQEYVPFPSRLQQQTKTVCLVITYIVFSMTNIIDTMDIMDIIEEEPCSVKVDMTLLKNPRICVNLKILDVDVVILVHLTTDAF